MKVYELEFDCIQGNTLDYITIYGETPYQVIKAYLRVQYRYSTFNLRHKNQLEIDLHNKRVREVWNEIKGSMKYVDLKFPIVIAV